jgi:hypothetical protein
MVQTVALLVSWGRGGCLGMRGIDDDDDDDIMWAGFGCLWGLWGVYIDLKNN